MIEDTIKKLEAQLQNASSISTERRRALVELLTQLRSEVSELSRTNDEDAESIAGFTHVSTHEATRGKPNREQLDLSLKGLRSSVVGFEKTHPKLAELVNSISNTLSNLGI